MIEKYYKKNYWSKLLEKEEVLEPFPNCPITKNTFFINLVYVNTNNNDIIDEWLMFPNNDALIGYLEYIWFPITFVSITNITNEIIIPEVTDTASIINILKDSKNIANKEYITYMENVDELLNNVIYSNNYSNLLELEEYFKKSFSKELDKFSYFKVFNSPLELGKFIFKEVDPENINIELKKVNGKSYDEWINICENVEHSLDNGKEFITLINEALDLL